MPILGKSATPEFGWKALTDSPIQGTTRSPWNLKHSPGGSSHASRIRVTSRSPSSSGFPSSAPRTSAAGSAGSSSAAVNRPRFVPK
jgi:hypothetical protein